MRFKCLPWDFSAKSSPLFTEGLKSIMTFLCSDPYITQMIKKKLSFKTTPLIGSEIQTSWLEQELEGGDLFSSQESFWVIESQNLSTPVKKLLTSPDLTLDAGGATFIFEFAQSHSFYQKLVKALRNSLHISIEMPPFWQNDKLLHFLAEEEQVTLEKSAFSYILDTIEPHTGAYLGILNQLKLTYPSVSTISLQQVKSLMPESKVDTFEYATLYNQGKRKELFEKLLNHSHDYEISRSSFRFLQLHLMKIIDPSYVEKKKKLSQYDKQIQLVSKKISKLRLLKDLRLFSQWEILSKQKGQDLTTKLRDEYLAI